MFKLEKDQTSDGSLCFKLVCTQKDDSIYLSDNITHIGELKELIEKMKNELDKIFLMGEKMFREYEEEKNLKDRQDSPEELWNKIKEMDDDDVVLFFNSLDLETRQRLSSYIMSSVNMFKGKGVLFAQFFNHVTYLLEKE
jgi:hypothetical protein